jgi:hypothetical protein
MKHIDYQIARTTLGCSVPEWINKLGISLDTHKSYSNGRNPVQAPVANHIETLLKLKDLQDQINDMIKG